MGAEDDQQSKWKTQLERLGETEVRNDLALHGGVRVGITSDAMQQFAFRWLREKEREREERERSTHSNVKWTFWAAVAAVVIGIVGVIATVVVGR